MRVGLLFGSFNPLHYGHLIVARYWLNETDLEQIWLVVSPHNPHKAPEALAPEKARLEMARLATEGDSSVQVSDIEFGLPRPSYTIATLRALRAQEPSWQWVVLLGADAAKGLLSWKEGESILQEWPVWVYPRRGAEPAEVPKYPNVRFFPQAPRIDLSATQVRQYVREGRSIRYLVPPSVEAYIYAHDFYHTQPAP